MPPCAAACSVSDASPDVLTAAVAHASEWPSRLPDSFSTTSALTARRSIALTTILPCWSATSMSAGRFALIDATSLSTSASVVCARSFTVGGSHFILVDTLARQLSKQLVSIVHDGGLDSVSQSRALAVSMHSPLHS